MIFQVHAKPNPGAVQDTSHSAAYRKIYETMIGDRTSGAIAGNSPGVLGSHANKERTTRGRSEILTNM